MKQTPIRFGTKASKFEVQDPDTGEVSYDYKDQGLGINMFEFITEKEVKNAQGQIVKVPQINKFVDMAWDEGGEVTTEPLSTLEFISCPMLDAIEEIRDRICGYDSEDEPSES